MVEVDSSGSYGARGLECSIAVKTDCTWNRLLIRAEVFVSKGS
jgi:hypothetical protein